MAILATYDIHSWYLDNRAAGSVSLHRLLSSTEVFLQIEVGSYFVGMLDKSSLTSP